MKSSVVQRQSNVVHEENKSHPFFSDDQGKRNSQTRGIGIHPSLFLATGILFGAVGIIKLRPDMVALGLIPFVMLGIAFLYEHIVFHHLSVLPLKASLHPHQRQAVTGQPLTLTCRLRNRLPMSLGTVSMDARTCSGLACAGHFVFDMPAHTEITFDFHVVPLRPGTVFFHSFWVQIRAPLGLFPRQFVLHLPVAFATQPAESQTITRHPRMDTRWEQRVEAGLHGDFSHLRAYVPGDPHRAIVPSASLRRRKPVVQLVHPEVSREWIFLIDVSPAAFAGLAGFTLFDLTSGVLPLWVNALHQSTVSVEFRAFAEDFSLHLPGKRPAQAVMRMADTRYRLPPTARLPRQESWWRVREWISWVYGVHVPDTLPEENTAAAVFLVQHLRRLVYAQGKTPGFESLDPEILIERFCAATGLEMPARTPRSCGLLEELNQLLQMRPCQLVIFSPLDPAPDAQALKNILHRLQRRGFSFLWMFLDSDGLYLRPHGHELLDLECRIRLDRVYPLLLQYGTVSFYNPSTFARQLPLLLRALTHGQPRKFSRTFKEV